MNYKESLKKSGFKLTNPRKLVLEALETSNHPASAKDLHKILRGKVDLASVYRTLNLLESARLAYKERFKNEDLYYLSIKQHHHIVCRRCGYAKCIPCEHLFSQIKGFKMIIHNLTISGICTKCINNH